MKKPAEFNFFWTKLLEDPRYTNARWRFPGVVKEITDGDTAWFMVDQGYRRYAYEAMRFIGFDTWERYSGNMTDRLKGKLAWEYLQKLLPINTQCALITHKEDESFSRWVAQVLVVFREEQLTIARQQVSTPDRLRALESVQEEKLGMVIDIAQLMVGTEHIKGFSGGA